MPVLGVALASIAAVLSAATLAPARVTADEGWVIRSFDARYSISEDGLVTVSEDIAVDFGSLEKHGIFRDIPVEYKYDADSNRLISLLGIRVDDGAAPVPFEAITGGPNFRIKIGDPVKLVTGQQGYRISYTISGGLTAFADHDELYWNVTGNEWPVPIERAKAAVTVPGPIIQRVTCFQGPTGSIEPCSSSGDESSAEFEASTVLASGSGLTFVVGLERGIVQVPPPVLVAADRHDLIAVADFFKLNPATIVLSALTAVTVFGALARLWWIAGRDRWFGEKYYFREDVPLEEIRPLFSHEAVVVEYQPPEIERRGRRLHPAEIGLLIDEKADTLDVSATIVDLAVHGHLVIREVDKGGILGAFKETDYELASLTKDVDDLLPYERTLLRGLFDGKETTKLSHLENKFYEDLSQVKAELYEESTRSLRFFARNPEVVRLLYRIAGAIVGVVGLVSIFLLGGALGAGLVGIPIAAGGFGLLLLAHLMPRRTAAGRQMYRRCLGFRTYMVTAEKERQAFAEKANIFHEYLPYAIVYGCVKKWAAAFEGIDGVSRDGGWYVGATPFVAASFADSIGDFSSSISSVMAATPGGSGSSGFSGGGSSGGGGGGGGGGSW
jgi:uncharacterized membrane protein YgcG